MSDVRKDVSSAFGIAIGSDINEILHHQIVVKIPSENIHFRGEITKEEYEVFRRVLLRMEPVGDSIGWGELSRGYSTGSEEA